jgi:hypothetical protein
MDTGYSILADSRSFLAAKKSLMQTDYQVTVGSVSALDFTPVDAVAHVVNINFEILFIIGFQKCIKWPIVN